MAYIYIIDVDNGESHEDKEHYTAGAFLNFDDAEKQVNLLDVPYNCTDVYIEVWDGTKQVYYLGYERKNRTSKFEITAHSKMTKEKYEAKNG